MTRSLVAVEETSGVLLPSGILVIARVLEEVTSPITASTLSAGDQALHGVGRFDSCRFYHR